MFYKKLSVLFLFSSVVLFSGGCCTSAMKECSSAMPSIEYSFDSFSLKSERIEKYVTVDGSDAEVEAALQDVSLRVNVIPDSLKIRIELELLKGDKIQKINVQDISLQKYIKDGALLISTYRADIFSSPSKELFYIFADDLGLVLSFVPLESTAINERIYRLDCGLSPSGVFRWQQNVRNKTILVGRVAFWFPLKGTAGTLTIHDNYEE